MRVKLRIAELARQRLDEVIRNGVFQPFGFAVNFAQFVAQFAHQIQLDQAVAADHAEGDFAPGVGENDAAILLIIDQPGGDQPLRHIGDRRRGNVQRIAQGVGRDALFLLL